MGGGDGVGVVIDWMGVHARPCRKAMFLAEFSRPDTFDRQLDHEILEWQSID